MAKKPKSHEPARRIAEPLRADCNQAGLACKQAQDALDFAKRPLLQKISTEIADEIDALEERSSQLRDRLKGMCNSAPDGLDGLSPRALHMMQRWAPPPEEHPQTNSPRYHKMLRWAEAYRAWRLALEEDPEAEPPEVPEAAFRPEAASQP